MSYQDDDDFLASGSGAPAISWAERKEGFKIKGQILSVQKTQQTKLTPTGPVPRTFDDGSPMYQHVFTLQTDARNPEIEDDDGQRRLYVKGSPKPESRSLNAAVKVAANARGYRAQAEMIGDYLEVTFLGKKLVDGFQHNQFSAVLTPGVLAAPAVEAEEVW